ncbi:MAG: porin [Planctomycetota bacterium]|nr:MAG: porin [Planctomycetota bacterium]
MKITKFALTAAIAAACLGGSVRAEAPAGTSADYDYYSEDAAPVVSAETLRDYSSVIPAAAGCSDAPVSNCDSGCGAGSCDGISGCDGGCDSACGCGPWKLIDRKILGFEVGGWTQLGYHTYNNTLFNQHADRIRLQQQWLWAEKKADGRCGLDFGGRIDYLYGVDAQDTQAFGILNNHWDNNWDHGIYGHAIPQLYGEVAMGDLSIKVGHFFTLIGYEVVGATGNFFYSHSYTMYNSEPFTHTGVLATYKMSNDLTVYGGYVMGWDSGFEDNGDAFLGGTSMDLTDLINVTSQYVIGRFGEAGAQNEVGFMTSTVITTQLSDSMQHVLWIDYLDTDGTGRARERQTFDVNNILLIGLTDNVTWGNRFEWYNIDKGVYGVTTGRSDVYAYTTGLNINAGTNLVFRPEVRWDWDKDRVVGNELGGSQTTFGMDAILTY